MFLMRQAFAAGRMRKTYLHKHIVFSKSRVGRNTLILMLCSLLLPSAASMAAADVKSGENWRNSWEFLFTTTS